jgi:hypothetical protein
MKQFPLSCELHVIDMTHRESYLEKADMKRIIYIFIFINI